MTTTRKLFIAAIAVTGIALGANAIADRDGGDRHHERLLGYLDNRLELDDGQRAALDALHAEMVDTRQLIRGNDDGLKSTIKGLVTAESFDQTRALELIEDRTASLSAQAPDLVNAAAVFLDGLSAEQKSELGELMDKRGRHRH